MCSAALLLRSSESNLQNSCLSVLDCESAGARVGAHASTRKINSTRARKKEREKVCMRVCV